MRGFDFSGVEHFWRVVKQLEGGCAVGEEVWDRLFKTPGYQALTASEFAREFFVGRWLAAYHPGQRAERTALQAKGDRFLGHYLRVSERQAELRRWQSELAGQETPLMERAYRRALEFLPHGEYPGPPGVAFVIFDMDARGYVPVVIDLLFALEIGTGLWALIAHETHHYLVSSARGLRIGEAGYGRSDLQWVLDQIHLEGVADIVSSHAPGIEVPSWLRTEMPAVPGYLVFLDELLRGLIEHPDRHGEVGAALRRSLRLSGHPVGFYMASAILEELGQRTVADVALDAGEFFAAYRRAALRSGSKAALSEESVDLIRVLG